MAGFGEDEEFPLELLYQEGRSLDRGSYGVVSLYTMTRACSIGEAFSVLSSYFGRSLTPSELEAMQKIAVKEISDASRGYVMHSTHIPYNLACVAQTKWNGVSRKDQFNSLGFLLH